MTRLFLALIGLLAFGGISQAQKPSSWEVSYVAGGVDGNGNFLGGTEIRELIPWNPGTPDAKLYAGNGYWEDVPGPEGFQTAQVLVLDHAHAHWRQDVSFGSFCPQPPIPPRCALATSALAKLFFSRDKTGAKVSVQVLVASTWDVRAAKPVPVNVYTKNNSGPCLPETDPSCQGSHDAWWETQLGTAPSDQGAPQVRSFAAHLDTVTGVNWAFAGEAPTGIFHGMLNDKRGAKQNIIEWTKQTPESDNVEFSTKDYQGPPCNGLVRVSSFAEAADAAGNNIRLYAAICYQIWVRVDGPDCRDPARPEQIGVLDVDGVCRHHWKVFWTDPAPAASSETGLRGLTMVKYQGKDVLLVGGEGGKLRIYRIDPDTGIGTAVPSVYRDAWAKVLSVSAASRPNPTG